METKGTINIVFKKEVILGDTITCEKHNEPNTYFTVCRVENINGFFNVTANNKRYGK